MNMVSEREKVWRIGFYRSERGEEKGVVEIEGDLYDLAEALEFGPYEPPTEVRSLNIFSAWEKWSELIGALEPPAKARLSAAGLRWLPAVPQARTLICVGANYSDHLKEMGVEASQRRERPFAFVKPIGTLNAHEAEVLCPQISKWVDWEGELGFVVGRRVRNVKGPQALSCIAGYVIVNDVSARDWLDDPVPGVGMDWILHKGFDGFSPVGPLVTPAAFVKNPADLRIHVSVNGVLKQDSSTSRMIFQIPEILEYLTSAMTLEPGDIIATGSPAGVGIARRPPERIAPGDEVTVQIERLGELTNPFVGER